MSDPAINIPEFSNRPKRSTGQRMVAFLFLLIGSVATGYGIILLVSGIQGAKNGDSLAAGLAVIPIFFGLSFLAVAFLWDRPTRRK